MLGSRINIYNTKVYEILIGKGKETYIVSSPPVTLSIATKLIQHLTNPQGPTGLLPYRQVR